MLARIKHNEFKFFPSYCNIKSPVDIIGGNLSINKITQKYQFNISMMNISPSPIKSVTVCIRLNNLNKEESFANETLYTYKVVSVRKGEIFGSDVDIHLDSSHIRDLRCFIKKVEFASSEIDDFVCDSLDDSIKLPKLKVISSLGSKEMSYIYKQIKNSEHTPIKDVPPIFLPSNHLENYWVCCCGRPNLNSNIVCSRCNREKKWQFENLSSKQVKHFNVKTNHHLLSEIELSQNADRMLTFFKFIIDKQSIITLVFAIITLLIIFTYSLSVIRSEPSQTTTITKDMQEIKANNHNTFLQLNRDITEYPVAVIHTSLGDIQIVLFNKQAEITVSNFISLAKDGYYDNTTFATKNKSFISSSDKASDGSIGESYWKYPLMHEISNELWAFRGAVYMVPDENNKNNSQFAIITKENVEQFDKSSMAHAGYPLYVIEKYSEVGGIPNLDTNITIFGQVYSGFETLKKIAETSTDEQVNIISVEIK